MHPGLRSVVESRSDQKSIPPPIPPAPGGMAHSVLTVNLKEAPDEPTKQAEERVIAFFKQRTGA